MLGAHSLRCYMRTVVWRAMLSGAVAVLVVGTPIEIAAQTVPAPPTSAPCTQNFSAGAFACGAFSSAVGTNSTGVGEEAAAGGTLFNGFTNASTTAFGAAAQAGATATGQTNATAVGAGQ